MDYRQFDLRTPHNCSSGPFQILVNLLCHSGEHAEVKSISINPVRTEQLAVGANDPYVRLYDRRMIKVTSAQVNNRTLQILTLDQIGFFSIVPSAQVPSGVATISSQIIVETKKIGMQSLLIPLNTSLQVRRQ